MARGLVGQVQVGAQVASRRSRRWGVVRAERGGRPGPYRGHTSHTAIEGARTFLEVSWSVLKAVPRRVRGKLVMEHFEKNKNRVFPQKIFREKGYRYRYR